MTPGLKVIIYEEKNILKEMLELLDTQYEALINKDVIQLDKLAKNLEENSRFLATQELKRRKIIGNGNIKETIKNSDDKNIKQAYKEIKNTITMIEIQKQANELLLKQQLLFTKKMINYIKPNKGIGTYNSYGKVGK